MLTRKATAIKRMKDIANNWTITANFRANNVDLIKAIGVAIHSRIQQKQSLFVTSPTSTDTTTSPPTLKRQLDPANNAAENNNYMQNMYGSGTLPKRTKRNSTNSDNNDYEILVSSDPSIDPNNNRDAPENDSPTHIILVSTDPTHTSISPNSQMAYDQPTQILTKTNPVLDSTFSDPALWDSFEEDPKKWNNQTEDPNTTFCSEIENTQN